MTPTETGISIFVLVVIVILLLLTCCCGRSTEEPGTARTNVGTAKQTTNSNETAAYNANDTSLFIKKGSDIRQGSVTQPTVPVVPEITYPETSLARGDELLPPSYHETVGKSKAIVLNQQQ